MTHDKTSNLDKILATDAELAAQLQSLLGRAQRRQLWLFFLSDDQRIVEPIMPMDDHPFFPDERCETDDLGEVPFSRLLTARVHGILEMIGAESVVFVWERPGPPKPGVLDVRWVQTIAAEAATLGVQVRAQYLLHSGGVRQVFEAGAEVQTGVAAA